MADVAEDTHALENIATRVDRHDGNTSSDGTFDGFTKGGNIRRDTIRPSG
ncbi:MAG: hypothetical protein R2865_11720 [Deinococcales bacterium]